MGGFMSFEMLDEGVQVTFRDENGDPLYAAPTVPPRG